MPQAEQNQVQEVNGNAVATTANAVQNAVASNATVEQPTKTELPAKGSIKSEVDLANAYALMRAAKAATQATENVVVEDKGQEQVQEAVSDEGHVAEEQVAQDTNVEQVDAGEVEEVETADFNPEQASKRALKRIDKLTARVKGYEEQNKALQAELEQLRSVKQKPVEKPITIEDEERWGKYAKVQDAEALHKEMRETEKAIEIIEDALVLNEVKTDENGKEYLLDVDGRKYTKAELLKHKREFQATIRDVIPGRIQAIEQSKQARAAAEQFIAEKAPTALKNERVMAEYNSFKESKYGFLLDNYPELSVYIRLGMERADQLVSGGKSVTTTAKQLKQTPRQVQQSVAAPSIASGEAQVQGAKAELEKLHKIALRTRKQSDIDAYMAYRRENKI